MINNQTKKYSYAIKNHGTFDVITSENEKLQDSVIAKNNFKLHILGETQSVKSSEKFYVFDWQKVSFTAILDPTNHPKEYTLWLDNKLVASSEKLKKQLHSLRVLKIELSFKGSVGNHEIKILSPNDEVILQLSFEVFPKNIHYKNDFKLLQKDCDRIVNKLSYELLPNFYKKLKNKPGGFTSNTNWWFILDALFDDLIKSLELIQRNPKHDIVTDEEVKQIDKVRKSSSKNKTWLTKNTQYISNNKEDGIELISGQYFSHALTFKKKVSYDNYENRFVKYIVNQIISRLTNLKKDLHKNSVSNNDKVVRTITNYTGRLHSILNKIPFTKVGNFEKETYFSSTLTKSAGYKDLLQIQSLLENGIETLDDNFSSLEYKKIDDLYAYWCLMKVFDIINSASNFKVKSQNILGSYNGKIKVNVDLNEASSIKLSCTENKEISLQYNKEKSLITMDLSTEKENLSLVRFYPNYQITNDYNEFLNDLDRSLISFKEKIQKDELKNKIILYPSHANDTNSHNFKKVNNSIKDFPTSPTNSDVLENYVRNNIDDKTAKNSVHELVGIQYQQFVGEKETFDKGILIGRLKKDKLQKRLSYLEKRNRYYFPFVKNKDSRIYNVSYLLFTKPESSKALLKKVKNWEILNKKELENDGVSWKLNSEHYLVFNLENETETVDTKNEIPIFSFRYTTLRGLSFFKSQQENNALYVVNESTYLLYKVLSKKDIEFTISWSTDEKDFTCVEFKLSNGLKLTSSNRYPNQHYMVKNELKPLTSLIDNFQ